MVLWFRYLQHGIWAVRPPLLRGDNTNIQEASSHVRASLPLTQAAYSHHTRGPDPISSNPPLAGCRIQPMGTSQAGTSFKDLRHPAKCFPIQILKK